jgi:hypothetical protein
VVGEAIHAYKNLRNVSLAGNKIVSLKESKEDLIKD